jgi:hypothetical protein
MIVPPLNPLKTPLVVGCMHWRSTVVGATFSISLTDAKRDNDASSTPGEMAQPHKRPPAAVPTRMRNIAIRVLNGTVLALHTRSFVEPRTCETASPFCVTGGKIESRRRSVKRTAGVPAGPLAADGCLEWILPICKRTIPYGACSLNLRGSTCERQNDQDVQSVFLKIAGQRFPCSSMDFRIDVVPLIVIVASWGRII